MPTSPLWLFGYGSLIWRIDFPFEERRTAALGGWTRRFWQRSTDHRGTVAAPGRVVTLIPDAAAVCWGVAYRLPLENLDRTLADLDYREKNGYQRQSVTLETATGPLDGIAYVADEANPHFEQSSIEIMAPVIARAAGPSGANREYVFELEAGLAALSQPDPHVTEVAHAVRTEVGGSTNRA